MSIEIISGEELMALATTSNINPHSIKLLYNWLVEQGYVVIKSHSTNIPPLEEAEPQFLQPFHLVYKENEEDHVSKGVTIKAVTATQALQLFHIRRIFQAGITIEPIFLAIYNMSKVSELLKLQIEQAELPR